MYHKYGGFMARSHKERHQWKDKERERTGKEDPTKIRVHRERFLAALKQCTEPVQLFDPSQRYQAALFRARLRLDPEEGQSQILFQQEEIDIPFLVENLEDCHYALAEAKTDFDPETEKARLDQHVSKALSQGFPCHLEVVIEEDRFCSSIVPCQFRQFDSEKGQALCTLPR
jgi:hypothetical protein